MAIKNRKRILLKRKSSRNSRNNKKRISKLSSSGKKSSFIQSSSKKKAKRSSIFGGKKSDLGKAIDFNDCKDDGFSVLDDNELNLGLNKFLNEEFLDDVSTGYTERKEEVFDIDRLDLGFLKSPFSLFNDDSQKIKKLRYT